MKWGDVDFETGIWGIETEPGEKGNPGSIRLPQVALDIIAAQPALVGNPYVFATGRSRKKKHGHFHASSKRKEALDAKLPKDMANWTIHDLRRTARSLMARIGILDQVGERVLGHKQGGVLGIYNRHHYQNEVADALALLAGEIDRILKPGSKVVALRG